MRRCLASAILFLASAPVIAGPRPMSPDAKADFDRGSEKYTQHDYAGAITAYDAGYAIDPHPDFLYAKAQAQRLGGDCNSAIVTYQAFLATDPPASEAELARNNIGKCEQVLAASKPTPPEAVPPEPPDKSSDRTVAVPRHDRVEPPPPPGGGEHPAWWHDNVGIALAGGGLVLLGIATVFTFRASSAADDTATAPTLNDWVAAHDSWDQDRVIAGVTAGLGAALAIGAGIRFWYLDRNPRQMVIATPTHGGAVVGVEGRW